jgi:WD40 repeat protein
MGGDSFEDRIKQLFVQAKDLSSIEQVRFLANEAPQLRRAVEKLLTAHRREALLRAKAEPQFDIADLVSEVTTVRLSCPHCNTTIDLVEPADEIVCSVCGGSFELDANHRQTTRVAGYEILGELGRGGMGVVYLARQVQLNRLVALKMILFGSHSGAAELARFRVEAEAVACLQHPNIVQIYEIGQQHGLPYFSLEFVQGGNLHQKLAATPINARDAARICLTLAEAVQYAHSHGIVHRDLKPTNILLSLVKDSSSQTLAKSGTHLSAGSDNWSGVIPKIADFGLAKQLGGDNGQTRSGAVLGTPSYMSPEQAAGKINEIGTGTDVYALGAILYEMLTGRPPFKAATPVDTIMQVLTDEPVAPSRLQRKVPRDLETICMKCLEKTPPRRYASAGLLADDLQRFLSVKPIWARRVGSGERAWKWVRRHPVWAALAGVSATAILLSVALVVSQSFQVELRTLNSKLEDALAEADFARRKANDLRIQTEAALARVERYRYFNLIALAQQELAMKNLTGAEQLLEQCATGLRGWEWSYLANRAHISCTYETYSNEALSVAASADGQRVATGFRDGSIRLHDETMFHEDTVDLKGHTAPITNLAFSADPDFLVSESDDETVRVWQIDNRDKILRREKDGPMYREVIVEQAKARAVAFSPARQQLALGGEDGNIRLTDISTRESRILPAAHIGQILTLAFSRSGRELASAGQDGMIRIWDPLTREMISELGPMESPVMRVVFNHDGQRVAAVHGENGDPGMLNIWNLSTRARDFTIGGGLGGVRTAAWANDGTQIAFGGRDGSIRLCDAKVGDLLAVFGGQYGPIADIAFDPSDHQRLVTVQGERGLSSRVNIWDLAPRPRSRALHFHSASVNAVVFSADGNRLVTASDDGSVQLCDLATERVLIGASQLGPVPSATVSSDGFLLAIAGEDGAARVGPIGTCTLDRIFNLSAGPAQAVAFSPDNSRIAVGGGETGRPGEICIWEVTSGNQISTISNPSGPVTSLKFTPDGTHLASVGGDGPVRIWNLAYGEAHRMLEGSDSELVSVALSPDGNRIAAGGLDKHAFVWDFESGKLLHVLSGHLSEIWAIAFSPDGNRLATAGGDGIVKLWDSATGLEACTLPTDARGCRSVTFGPENQIAAGNTDGSVILWIPGGDDE